MRRFRSILLAAAAGLVVQITAGDVRATDTTTPTEPSGSEQQTAAEAALLVLGDFPAGWTEAAEEEPTEQDRAYRRQVADCAGGTGDDLLDLGGPQARTGDFIGPDDQRVEQTVTIVEPTVAEDFIARFAAPGVDTCFRDAVQAFMTESLENPEDPAQTLPGDLTVDDVTVAALALAPAGDELVAYRVTLTMSVSGETLDAIVDVVALRAGGSLAGLTFQALFEPFPAEEVEQYMALAAERLPG